MSNEKITCYTDGACPDNPAAGGFGIVFLKDNKISSCFYGGNEFTTNNRMELYAVICALKLAYNKGVKEIDVYSDSAYVVNAFQQNWVDKWQKNNWVNSKGEPVKNKLLWCKLIDLVNNMKVSFVKVSGHSGECFNEIADKLAVKGADEMRNELIENNAINKISIKEIESMIIQ